MLDFALRFLFQFLRAWDIYLKFFILPQLLLTTQLNNTVIPLLVLQLPYVIPLASSWNYFNKSTRKLVNLLHEYHSQARGINMVIALPIVVLPYIIEFSQIDQKTIWKSFWEVCCGKQTVPYDKFECNSGCLMQLKKSKISEKFVSKKSRYPFPLVNL